MKKILILIIAIFISNQVFATIRHSDTVPHVDPSERYRKEKVVPLFENATREFENYSVYVGFIEEDVVRNVRVRSKGPDKALIDAEWGRYTYYPSSKKVKLKLFSGGIDTPSPTDPEKYVRKHFGEHVIMLEPLKSVKGKLKYEDLSEAEKEVVLFMNRLQEMAYQPPTRVPKKYADEFLEDLKKNLGRVYKISEENIDYLTRHAHQNESLPDTYKKPTMSDKKGKKWLDASIKRTINYYQFKLENREVREFPTPVGPVYAGMSKEDLYLVYPRSEERGYKKNEKEEWIIFSNWATDIPGDMIVIYLREGKVKKWERD